MAEQRKKLMLVDALNLLFRGFYAMPLFKNQMGEYTNAVFGFLHIFLRFLDEERPDCVVVAFDMERPTFRHEQFAEYKGTRVSAPEEFFPQIDLLKEVLAAMRIDAAECPGYEADDVLGSLAVQAEARGYETIIVSGDRDLLQIASETVKIRIPKTRAGKTEVEDYYAADVFNKYGVTPRAFIDVKALMGDASDNIPGVPGIGEVTAAKIIAAYGSVENAVANAADIKPKKASENLLAYREQALLSKELATIALDAPVELDEDAARVGDIWNAEAFGVFKRLEFKSLYKRFEKEEKEQINNTVNYAFIETEIEAAAVCGTLIKTSGAAAPAALYMLSDNNEILGLCVASGGGLTCFDCLVIPCLQQWLESDSPKVSYDIKHDRLLLSRLGIELNGVVFDVSLAHYVLNALNAGTGLNGIIGEYLPDSGMRIPEIETLLDNKNKRGKERRALKDLPAETLNDYAARAADIIYRAEPVMRGRLVENGQLSLYMNIELPLAHVLTEMEQTGVRIDKDILTEYGAELDAQIARLTDNIYSLAGEEFNIQSPAQLGVILFEKLGLKGSKKNTQGWSTAADILEKLAGQHPIVPLVLEYRNYTKLKSTYVDGLIPLIDPVSSRVYSTFNQALTATGRLSSTEPNLQNIPVRMPLGRLLRRAFVPEGGYIFIDADYSQIELRILAHVSGDETLINAFIEGQDIHRITASQVFHTPPEQVTREQRSAAKAVNFGIVYGISSFGLSEDLNISKKEAERYIQGYFETYPRVKRYMDETVAQAKRDGFVSTLFNRRRAVPELQSPNFTVRSFGERVAMNMPIQGAAADIIKIAMINVWRGLKKENLRSRLILQVHDELLLEAAEGETEAVKALLKQEMENAARLSLPLVADIHEGKSWYDAK